MSDFILFCEAQTDWGDINYALVSLTRTHVQWLLDRMQHAQKLKDANENFYSLEYFHYACEWYKDIMEAEELAEWQDVFEQIAGRLERTDLNTIIITNDTCQWTAHPKHADDTIVRTPLLTIEQLRNLL